MELKEEMQRLIDRCREKFEAHKNESFYSTVYHAELKETQYLAKQLQETGPEALLAKLREEQAQLEADLEREEYSPTFDWYDEHYHAKCLIGNLDARKAVEKLLVQACGEE